MGKLDGKVALISGVARGQGRSHAVRLAEEGAKIVGFDICEQMSSVTYPMATLADLKETISLVEQAGGEIVAEQADVRDAPAVAAVVEHGMAEFGRLDIVIANAGIMPIMGEVSRGYDAWNESVDVLLTGAYITIRESIEAIRRGGRGGSVVITSSTAGLKGMASDRAGSLGYAAAKTGVVGLMRGLTNAYSSENIRFNTVHPTGVNTPMVVNEQWDQYVAENPAQTSKLKNQLPVELIEPIDVSNAIVWLVSDDARYVTGVELPVDAGFTV